MSGPELEPTEVSPRAQEFLFACAFWIMAADEQLTGEEQAWLFAEFGDSRANQLIQKTLAIESDDFLPYFDTTVNALSDDDKRTVYPQLPPWLCRCLPEFRRPMRSEGFVSKVEMTSPLHF